MYGAPNYVSELIVSGITALVTGFLTWFFSRKKLATEVESLELDLVDRAITIWRTQSLELSNQVNEIRKELGIVRSEYETLKKENEGLSRENETLKKENASIRKQVDTLRKRLNKYEKTISDSISDTHES